MFTKFDGQVVQALGELGDIKDDRVKLHIARENAEATFQETYLPKVFHTDYPPKEYVRLEGEIAHD